MAGELIDFLCQGITLAGSDADIEGGDGFGIELTKQRRILAGLQELAGCTGNARCRAVSLQTTVAAASAGTAVLATHRHMAQLSGEAVAAVDQLSVDDDTRTYTRSEGKHDEVFHATSHTVGHFTDGSSIGIIGHGNRDAEFIGEHLCQGNDRIFRPYEVRSLLDGSLIVVGIRCADAHRLDGLDATDLFNDNL